MINALPVPITLPSMAGSLEGYIQAVNRFPLLTEEEESRLAREFRDTEDVDAARQLVLSHLRLVVSIARGYLGYGLPHADLIQEGNVGLMKAVKRFDPERGVRLVSFAVHWIRAEIHEHILRNWRIVKIATTKAQRKLFFNLRSMKKSHGSLSPQETAEMAAQLNVKTSDVSEMETRLGGQDIALEPVGEDDEDSFGPISYLSNPDEEPGRILEGRAERAPAHTGLEQCPGESGSTQPPHHRSPLAAGDRHGNLARAGGRIRRIGRTHPANRIASDEENARADSGA